MYFIHNMLQLYQHSPLKIMITTGYSRKNLMVTWLFFVLSLVTYSNSLSNPFLMDDHALVLQNRKIGDISHLQLNPFSKQTETGEGSKYIYYRPITHLADYVSFLLFEKDVTGYHVLNLFLFFLCSVTLYHFLTTLPINGAASLLTCLLFITHPINGVLINYTSTTGYILLILFHLLGFLSYVKYGDTQHLIYLYLSLLCFCLSLLCHETAIFFPVYLAAILYFIKKHHFRKLVAALIPFLIISSTYLFFRMHYASLKSGVIDNIAIFDLSFLQYIVKYFYLLLSYLKNLILLRDIVLIYSAPYILKYPFVWLILFALSCFATVYLIFVLWRDTLKAFALSWIVIGFGPVTLACFSRPSMGLIISPHWLLISSIGYCLLIALMIESVYTRHRNKIILTIPAFLLVCFIFVSRQYNQIWANEIRYCLYMLRLSPNIPLTKFWLANAYFEKGDLQNARFYFKETIMGVENDWKAYSNLGVIEGRLGNKDMELQYYFKALQQKPDSTDLLNNIAAVYIEKKEYGKAEKILTKILSMEPDFSDARRNLDILQSKKHQDSH